LEAEIDAEQSKTMPCRQSSSQAEHTRFAKAHRSYSIQAKTQNKVPTKHIRKIDQEFYQLYSLEDHTSVPCTAGKSFKQDLQVPGKRRNRHGAKNHILKSNEKKREGF